MSDTPWLPSQQQASQFSADLDGALQKDFVPVEAYHTRAANRPLEVFRPHGSLVKGAKPRRTRALPETCTFFNDISKYQPVVDGSYPFPVLSMRVHSGYSIDLNAVANWNVAKASKSIRIVIGYVVFIPGQLDAALAAVRQVFGVKCPDKVALMVDVESGVGFAGPGDHSAEANRWLKVLGDYAGSMDRILAYANQSDFAECWPGLPTSVKKVTAKYSTTDPRTWGWQYYGGDPRWSSPDGYPRSAPPFGQWVDCNVVHRTVRQMKQDLGLPFPPPQPPVPPVPPVPGPNVPTPEPGPKPRPKPQPNYQTYRVKANDSLLTIAAHFGVGWRQLVRWNQKKHPSLATHPDLIQIGWKLRVSK